MLVRTVTDEERKRATADYLAYRALNPRVVSFPVACTCSACELPHYHEAGRGQLDGAWSVVADGDRDYRDYRRGMESESREAARVS